MTSPCKQLNHTVRWKFYNRQNMFYFYCSMFIHQYNLDHRNRKYAPCKQALNQLTLLLQYYGYNTQWLPKWTLLETAQPNWYCKSFQYTLPAVAAIVWSNVHRNKGPCSALHLFNVQRFVSTLHVLVRGPFRTIFYTSPDTLPWRKVTCQLN